MPYLFAITPKRFETFVAKSTISRRGALASVYRASSLANRAGFAARQAAGFEWLNKTIPVPNQKDNKAPMRGSTKVHCWCIEATQLAE
jgi:hypothetical protein